MESGLMKKWIIFLPALYFSSFFCSQVSAQGKTLSFKLRTRNHTTNQIIEKDESVETTKVGIVIVDPWNYHWCMTWTEQAGGMATRMNRANEAARKMGIQIFWAPTDVAAMYTGWPQRQRAMAVPYLDVPRMRDYNCTFHLPDGDCLCGPGIACKLNYGFDAINPSLKIADEDLIVAGTKELYSLCKAKGITHLVYFGGATNICLTGKPEGISFMYGAGLETIFARDLSFAMTAYDPEKSYTPSTGNIQATDDLERAGIPTLSFVDELRKQSMWDEKWITEPIRITPSGTVTRPYFFEKTVTVSLEAPYLKDVDIRYTLDGTEPKPSSPKYTQHFVLQNTSKLRTAAFRKDKKVSLDGLAYFVLMPPPPPKPDIPVSELKQVTDLYGAMNPVYAACLWQPVVNKSYEDKSLHIREKEFGNGLGMRGPAYIRYELKPGLKRFVALAGIDDHILDKEYGRNIAMYPKIVFKVFIDGVLAGESPVMRISQEPWRFNLPIPDGSRDIVLVCDDMGDRSPYNLGDWVDAGFCIK
jgi:hypothetical protein